VEDEDGLDPAVGDARRPADLRQRLPVLHGRRVRQPLWETGVVLWGVVG
jgi:hypothetical protein